MKILIVVGARPNFMKAAPIIAAIRNHNVQVAAHSIEPHAPFSEAIEQVLVHTGQHYDDLMSASFFGDLNLPTPDVHLGVGSGSHASQTAEILRKFEGVLLAEKPEAVIVVGDVNSTLACALVTSKISLDQGRTRPLIAHVEAGLRSFDRSMPEEINRILTDHLSDLLFVTEESGAENLSREGVPSDKIYFVGNTMIDSLLAFQDKAEASTVLERLKLRTQPPLNGESAPICKYAVLTLHRPANVDDRDNFSNILAGLEDLMADYPVIFSVHPRTRKRIEEFGLELGAGAKMTKRDGRGPSMERQRVGIILTDPLGYLDFLCLMKHAAIVVTDSGGIQEETTCLGIPCVTVRENTERPVTVTKGTNIVAGIRREGIKAAIQLQIGRNSGAVLPKNWDGQAAARIVDILARACTARTHGLLHDITETCP